MISENLINMRGCASKTFFCLVFIFLFNFDITGALSQKRYKIFDVFQNLSYEFAFFIEILCKTFQVRLCPWGHLQETI